MDDGTTAFSMALAKGRCDLMKELLRFKRKKDVQLARYALLETKLNENVKQVLLEAVGTVRQQGSQAKLSKE